MYPLAFMLLDAFASKHCATFFVPYMALVILATSVVIDLSSAGGTMCISRRTSQWKCTLEIIEPYT